jgi:hypothetical protein
VPRRSTRSNARQDSAADLARRAELERWFRGYVRCALDECHSWEPEHHAIYVAYIDALGPARASAIVDQERARVPRETP